MVAANLARADEAIVNGDGIIIFNQSPSITAINVVPNVDPAATGPQVIFADSNGVSWGVNGNTVTASVNPGAGGGIAAAAGTQTAATGTVNFADSNGITFGMSLSSQITGTVRTSYAGINGAITGGSITVNTSGVSVNLPAYLTTAMLSNAATISNLRVSAGTTSNLLSAITFADSNGVSWGLNASTVTATVATNYQSQGAYLTTAMLSNAATISNIRVSAGTTSNLLSAITFADSNGVSWGLNASTVTATVKTDYLTSQSTDYNAITLAGNTQGTTTFHATNNRTIFLNGGANITLSGNGSTITIVGPAAAGNTISSYENMDAGMQATQTQSVGQSTSAAAAFMMPLAISASFLRFPIAVTTATTAIASTASSANASGELYTTWNAVVYSLGVGANSKSLQSVASGSIGLTFRNSVSIAANGSQYSITQQLSQEAEGGQTTTSTQYSASSSVLPLSSTFFSAAFTGSIWQDVRFANSLSAGPYWLVLGKSTNSATNSTRLTALTNCNVGYTNHYVMSQHSIWFGIMGSTNLTSGGLLGAGSVSTSGAAGTVASIPISAISSSASNNRLYFQLLRSA